MPVNRSVTFASIVGIGILLGCAPRFKVSAYPSTESLFAAGVREMQAHRWDNAVTVFDKLTLELPARDTLLPIAQYYLAQSYAQKKQHLLSAQAYYRLSESFATDSLADDALYHAGREYQQMWRKPSLDAQYGTQAEQTYQLMLGLYPDSPWRDSATVQIGVLHEWFARKDYGNAMHYFRRRAWDSAIIYLRSVVDQYPNTATVRDAYLKLAKTYDEIHYRDDRAEVCKVLHDKYPGDAEVSSVCGPVAAAAPAPAP